MSVRVKIYLEFYADFRSGEVLQKKSTEKR
jgi:hypothetical protein